MKLNSDRLCIVLSISLACISVQAIAQDDDPKMMEQLAQFKQQCEQEHAREKQEIPKLEAAKTNSFLTPQQMQQVEQKLQALNQATKKMDEFLAQPLPAKKEARESYLRQASADIAKTRESESTVAKDLGVSPTSTMEMVLARLGSAEGFMTKNGSFNQADHAYNPDPNAPVAQGGNSHFFGFAGQLPPSAIPTNKVSPGYLPTSVQEANAQAVHDHGTGGGIMLEGTAGGLEHVSSVEYDGSVNALILNNDLVYFVKIPPWSLATMCREIGTDRNTLLGVSETMTEGLVFGDKPEIYTGSDLAYELMLADKFLGDLVFAQPNGWTQGYVFPRNTKPREAKIKSNMLVRFAFGNFHFTANNGQLSVDSSSLEVRMLPVSQAASPTGQMLPNYNALDKHWSPPEAFIANVKILTDNVDYFRREPLIEDVFSDGEVAAVLRTLKESGKNLNALADQIETGNTR